MQRFILALFLLPWVSAGVYAQHDLYRALPDEPDVESTPAWEEGKTTIPAFPDKENLLAFSVPGPGAGYRYGVDRASLSVAPDGLVRYVVVVESNAGARNVLFEAINCRTKAYKTFAYGSSGGKFRRVGQAAWRPFASVGPMAYREELAREYYCDGFLGPRPLEQILRRLEQADRPSFRYDGSYAY